MAHGFIGPHHLNPEDFMPSAGQFRQPKFHTCVLNLQRNEGASVLLKEKSLPAANSQYYASQPMENLGKNYLLSNKIESKAHMQKVEGMVDILRFWFLASVSCFQWWCNIKYKVFSKKKNQIQSITTI